MNKKLLLSTLLSSALLTSTAATAFDITLGYDGGGAFNISGAKYKNLDVVNFARINSTALPDRDAVSVNIDANAIITDVTNGIISREDLTKTLTYLSGRKGLKGSQALTDISNALGLKLSFFDSPVPPPADPLAANKLALVHLSNVEDTLQEGLQQLEEMKTKNKDFFREVSQDLDRIGRNSQQLEEEINRISSILLVLQNKNNLTNEEAATLETGKKSLLANPSYLEIRKSDVIQSILEKQVESVINARSATNNEKLRVSGSQAMLEKLKTTLELFVNPAPTSGENVAPLQKPDTAVSDALIDASLITRNLIDSRISGFTAVAAGDMMETYGVWAKANFTNATQKAHGGSNGYTASQTGATIGVDTGDETLVGIAYSFARNDVKGKANKKNKEDITSHAISAYGKLDATNEIFLTGQAQFGIGNIKKERDTGVVGNDIASAKTKASTIAAKAEIGYDYSMKENDLHIIPSVGIAYTDVTIKGYKESGTGLNREISKRISNRTSGIASLMIKYAANKGNTKIIPEIHADVDYAFSSKNDSTSVTFLEGIAPIATPSQKQEKGRYNLGASIKAIGSDMFEFTAGYDFGLAKHFQSHTGTLKVRINL